MRLQMRDEIKINAPAAKVWRVLAHEFDTVDRWSSGIKESMAIMDMPVLEGAMVGGRVCLSDGIGGDVQEAFTYYDEQEMRFGYEAIGDIPMFFKSAGNNWRVIELDPNNSVVEFSADVDLKIFPGTFLLLLFPLVKKVWGSRTLEELKYYIEHDKPHPRKVKAQQKQMKLA